MAAKGSRTISVVLPALNEEETVGSVVETITPLVGGLVDELIVLDSGSTDDTEIRALAAGARVISREVALPEVPPQPGKGEVLWRSLAATTGDIVVFVDSDLIDPDPMFVPKLVGPLLTTEGVHLVKGFYRRPLKVSGSEDANGGGRVTELVARPLLAALRPELSYLMQPLGGEYAGTRELLTSVPFAPGYGVEIGLLIDTYDRLGLDAIAQVNLGVREHRNRPLTELATMSRQVIATLLSRCGVPDSAVGLTQFFADGDDYTPRTSEVSLADRPPMITLRPPLGCVARAPQRGSRRLIVAPLRAGGPRGLVGPVRQYRERDPDPAVPGGADPGVRRAVRRGQRAVRARRGAAAAAPRHHRDGVARIRCHRRRRRSGQVHPDAARLQDQRGRLGAGPAGPGARPAARSAGGGAGDPVQRRRRAGGGTRRRRCACAAVRGQGRLVTATPEDDGRVRCGWIDQSRLAPADFTLYRDYHDTEWGRPLRDSKALFERVSLEAFQSGLSWLIILRKRENFRRAFHRFDIDRVARYTDRDIERLMDDAGIVRNRSKIEATIANARAAADLDVDLGELLWSFAPPSAATARRPVRRFLRSPRNRRRWPRN